MISEIEVWLYSWCVIHAYTCIQIHTFAILRVFIFLVIAIRSIECMLFLSVLYTENGIIFFNTYHWYIWQSHFWIKHLPNVFNEHSLHGFPPFDPFKNRTVLFLLCRNIFFIILEIFCYSYNGHHISIVFLLTMQFKQYSADYIVPNDEKNI